MIGNKPSSTRGEQRGQLQRQRTVNDRCPWGCLQLATAGGVSVTKAGAPLFLTELGQGKGKA